MLEVTAAPLLAETLTKICLPAVRVEQVLLAVVYDRRSFKALAALTVTVILD